MPGRMLPTFDNVAQVRAYMNDHLKDTEFRGETQEFLPTPDFNIVTSEGVIRTVISKDEKLFLGHKDRAALILKISQEGRKMFATCVYGSLPMTCLKALFDDGLSDCRFPFKIGDAPGQKDNQKFIAAFIKNQKIFNVAFFARSSEQILDGGIRKPIDYDESEDAMLGKGAFGEVYKIGIHPGQRSFTSGANSNGHFAMKVTPHKGTREVFFHRAMAKLSHDHLLKCLASFVFSSKYHMIYEKADCNVEEFMKRYADPRKLANFTSGHLAQQLFGLADALCFIHNQGSSDSQVDTKLLGVPKKSSRRSGYIHDIKPENLLMFIYNRSAGKTYWIRMSDFSCAKVVDILETVSGKNRDSWKTASKSGTPVYRAPEAITEGRTSRPYDLFSLGCVFLELLVWFLDGYDALKAFRDQRECLLSPNTYEDEGFYYKTTDDEEFRLRDAVAKKIEDVRSRCSGTLKDVADVIPNLLQMDPQQRPTAKQLVDILKPIDNGTKPPLETDRQSNEPLLASPDISGSDSDSSFGDLVKVQHPTEE
ncbi:hypothetical protein E8E12_005727 [Didymella heteroderae]|uniref:Protein kinase domain-containing protein n=1 Tax=Didymella heteroderae TaxID=1769908 RepID=A0A9P4WJI5_9PLEO|nr:hypothetical protein E8E12_005727 [Didymella heteroderae]